MTSLIFGPFYVAVGAYVAAAVFGLLYGREGDPRFETAGSRLAWAGMVFLAGVFIARWWNFGLVPFTGLGDSLNLFLILTTLIMQAVRRDNAMKPLMAVYLPSLGLLAVICAGAAPEALREAPRPLLGVPLTLHVGMVFLAFALFFVASLTSIVYALKAQHLKARRTTGYFHRAPSLEQLDRTLYRLISVGYPVFVVTLGLGYIWAWAQRDLLGPYWFVSSKVVFALVMVAFYAVCFHVRQFGRLRGPKLAYLVFFGFTFLLAAYLAMGLLHASSYSFWEVAG